MKKSPKEELEKIYTNINQPTIRNDAVALSLNQDDIVTPDISKVLIIYTGGTIGMKNNNKHGYLPVYTLASMSRFHDHNFNKHLHRLSKDQSDFTEEDDDNQVLMNKVSVTGSTGPRNMFRQYEPLLDSCNISSEDWVRIAVDIELNYEAYDAFIILHGTDTMSYTASALSFLLENLGKTVILTGSQVPISEVRNDAVENLLGALTIAGHYVIPEVCLFFNNKLFRGNRSVKMNALEFNAFDSPNLVPLAVVGINIDVNWAEIVRPSALKFRAHKTLNRNVSSLRLFPGITDSTVKALLAPPIEGVILETYGAGNAPDTRDDLMRVLAEACGRGVVIVNCSQCKRGMVTELYATGKALARVGAVPGNDMTPENDTRYSPKVVRELMTKNLRGELTVLAPKPRYSFHNRTHKIIQNMIGIIGSGDNSDITAADITSDSALMINIQENILLEKSIYPILLCSAAGTDDLEGMLLLFETYEAGHHRIVKFLLQKGASVHMRDIFGHTPLFEAARNKHKNVIKLLRETGDVELLQHFITAGMDINRTGFDHRTALHHAVAEGRVNVVKYLLSLPEINFETKDRWSRKPIDDAEMNLGRMWGRDNDREKELREIVGLLREREDCNFINNFNKEVGLKPELKNSAGRIGFSYHSLSPQ
ncbi:2959_t:CDS:10 [Diversispora eburnea]|uniref:asparaginase n=1 Tax=Diversispora eburnea TaxID=1213867 RepID=A0A9N9FE04_9GLOM|nr:2959_t:CDS:10 [Diversispora eburnea]